MESEAIKVSSCMTRALYTAKNSNVEVAVVNDNEINNGDALSFDLSVTRVRLQVNRHF